MKKILLLIIFITGVLSGCKKADTTTVPDPKITPPTGVTYTPPNIKLDVVGSVGKAVLSWTAEGDDIESYQIFRSDADIIQTTEIYKTADRQQLTYVDNEVPYKEKISYRVVAKSKSKLYYSNTVSYVRSDLDKILNIQPNDIIYNKEDQLVYIIQRWNGTGGTVYIYDILKDKIVASVNTDTSLSYADLGTYNGKKELYVPGYDGNIFVYDALTLNKITQIKTGLQNYCVVYHKNNLYVSTSGPVAGNPLWVINRGTSAKVSEAGFFPTTRFKQVPNTDFHLLEFTSASTSPVGQSYYKFTSDGKFLTRLEDTYHESWLVDDRIFDIFPDGSKYITTSMGKIFNIDMTKSGSLPGGNLNFTSFAFDKAQPIIYASTMARTIEVYNLVNYEKVKSYSTSGYPFKIIDLGNQILCFSLVSTSLSINNQAPLDVIGMIVEKVSK